MIRAPDRRRRYLRGFFLRKRERGFRKRVEVRVNQENHGLSDMNQEPRDDPTVAIHVYRRERLRVVGWHGAAR